MLPLGTRIMLDRPAFGRRVFTVEDRIGSGSELDIFNPSESACLAYGRQTRGFTSFDRALARKQHLYTHNQGGSNGGRQHPE